MHGFLRRTPGSVSAAASKLDQGQTVWLSGGGHVQDGESSLMDSIGPRISLAADLAVSDLKSKYKRSLAGWLWLPVAPLASLMIYWVVFGYIFKVEWQNPLTKEPAGFILPFLAGL